MDDDEVMTLVRGQRHEVPLNVPVDDIIRRGRAVRARRFITGSAGGLTVALGLAVAAIALTPGSQPNNRQQEASHEPTVRLAAWTVTKQPDGKISVTIRQLHDPTGLQSTLRADGVPASVTFTQPNPACQNYPEGTPDASNGASPLLKSVFPTPYKHLRALPLQGQVPKGGLTTAVPTSKPTLSVPSDTSTTIVIDRSALPRDAGVQLGSSPDTVQIVLPQLVYASPQCTGS